ncbi:hypothetical protein BJ741DRAFT_630879 [Chytriomyces cf. hyalinus JEL632]|nr:hypothetical protein BJ741DRAFT_630879 [Chytriomyces cf. hyalinus JEL632]
MNWTGGNGQKGFGRGTRAQIRTLSAHAVKQKSKLRRAFKPGKTATTLFETLSRSRQCPVATGSKDVALLRMPVSEFERDEMECRVDEASRRSLSPAPSDHQASSPILLDGPLSTSHNSLRPSNKAAERIKKHAYNYVGSSTTAIESLATTADPNVRRETDWKKLLWPTHAPSESIASVVAEESNVTKRGTEERARTRTRTPRLEPNAQDLTSRISALESRVKRLEHKVCM